MRNSCGSEVVCGLRVFHSEKQMKKTKLKPDISQRNRWINVAPPLADGLRG